MSYRWICALALLLTGVCTQVWADNWPSRPIRVIVPYPPGSATDIIPRTVFAEVQKQLGQPIVIENRPGAGSTIGTAAVAKAEPDGYTFLVAASAYTTLPLIFPNITYDPVKDLTGVIPLANSPTVLVVAPAKGIKTVGDLVAAARANPGAMNYVTIGPGSAAHFATERFRFVAKFEAQPVSYKGSPEGLTDVMTGRVDFYFSPLLPALPLIRDGRLVALAVSNAQRSPDLPNVPTTIEAGFPSSEYDFWFGVFAPSKTPSDILKRFYEETAKALRDPGVQDRLKKLGQQPMPMTPQQFNEYVQNELKQNAELAKAAGIKFQ